MFCSESFEDSKYYYDSLVFGRNTRIIGRQRASVEKAVRTLPWRDGFEVVWLYQFIIYLYLYIQKDKDKVVLLAITSK